MIKKLIVFWFVFLCLLAAGVALATPPKGKPKGDPIATASSDQHQQMKQGQAQSNTINISIPQPVQKDGVTLDAADTINLSTADSISLDAGDTSFSSNTENNSSNVVLVPNNNTENCLRVWGISFGNSNGAGGIGIPTRSAACDFEQAADDAASVGNHDLAWFWRCHKGNIYKPFRVKGGTKQEAIGRCHNKMLAMIGTAKKVADLESDLAHLLELREMDARQLKEQRERLQKDCNERTERLVKGCYK